MSNPMSWICPECGYANVNLGGVKKPCYACELMAQCPDDKNICSECGEVFAGGYEETIAICDGCLESKQEDMREDVA